MIDLHGLEMEQLASLLQFEVFLHPEDEILLNNETKMLRQLHSDFCSGHLGRFKQDENSPAQPQEEGNA